MENNIKCKLFFILIFKGSILKEKLIADEYTMIFPASILIPKKRLVLTSFLIMSGVFCANAYADCNLNVTALPSFRISGTINVPKDAAVGDRLTPVMTAAMSFTMTADTLGFIYKGVIFDAPSSGMKSGNAFVYKTNISGIGIAYVSEGYYNADGQIYSGIYADNSSFNITAMQPFNYWLVKTGTISQGGVLTSNSASTFEQCYRLGPIYKQDYFRTPIGDANIVLTSCKLSDTEIIVPMGVVNTTDFKTTGTVVGLRSFEIPLACDTGSNVSFSIAPSASGSQNSDQGIINLDNPTDSATAKGVGLQLLFKNAPLKLNQYTSAGSAQTQSFNIPLQAQYIQTANTVTAGTANAAVTVVIKYN